MLLHYTWRNEWGREATDSLSSIHLYSFQKYNILLRYLSHTSATSSVMKSCLFFTVVHVQHKYLVFKFYTSSVNLDCICNCSWKALKATEKTLLYTLLVFIPQHNWLWNKPSSAYCESHCKVVWDWFWRKGGKEFPSTGYWIWMWFSLQFNAIVTL